MHQLVGINYSCAQLLQHPQHNAFAGSYIACQANYNFICHSCRSLLVSLVYGEAIAVHCFINSSSRVSVA